jgi:hypothetical protein
MTSKGASSPSLSQPEASARTILLSPPSECVSSSKRSTQKPTLTPYPSLVPQPMAAFGAILWAVDGAFVGCLGGDLGVRFDGGYSVDLPLKKTTNDSTYYGGMYGKSFLTVFLMLISTEILIVFCVFIACFQGNEQQRSACENQAFTPQCVGGWFERAGGVSVPISRNRVTNIIESAMENYHD